MLARVRKNDTVIVLSGKDKDKKGLVTAVYPKDDSVVVKDMGLVTRHVKQKKAGQKGGIVQKERPLPLAKVMPICGACKKPCRVMTKVLESGEKVRACARCKEVF